MTISIQLTCKSSLSDELLAKSQTRDVEAIPSLSFGEVLKDEEKKLQQELETSASSVSAVLSAMQSQPAAIPASPIPDMDAGNENKKSDMGAASLHPTTVRSSENDLSSLTGAGKNLTAANPIKTQAPESNTPQAARSAEIDMPAQTESSNSVAEAKPVKTQAPESNTQATRSAEIDMPAQTETSKNIVEAKPVKTHAHESNTPQVAQFAEVDIPAQTETSKSVAEAKPVKTQAPDPMTQQTTQFAEVDIPAQTETSKNIVEAKPVKAQAPESNTPQAAQSAEIDLPAQTETSKSVVEANPIKTQAPDSITPQATRSAETNMPAQLVNATAVPAAIQADNQLKAQPNLENIKASQPTPASEESSPAAKDQEPVPTLESTRTTAAADMQTFIVKESGKFSMAEINSQAAEVIQQIMSQMKVKIKSGVTSMRLLLNPKELGEIEVQMIRNTEGVSVTFFAEQANTARMLETQMNQLRQSLKDAGVQLTDLNFSQHDQPKHEGGFLKQGPNFGQYLQDNAPQIELANKVVERPQRIDGLSNEVDYLI